MTRERFFDRPDSCYFAGAIHEAAQYCREHHPLEAAHVIRVADLACEKKFLFVMKWDPLRSYDWISYEGERIDWLRIPAEDTEFLWQLNRHRHFIYLGQAYILTGDEKYARAFVEQATDWMENVPLKPELCYGPWRSLEVGLRGEYWNKALRYFKDSPLITDSFLECFHRSMKQHAEHLMACHSPYRYISNWGVMENHGLFDIALCLPQDEDTRRYAAFALRNLEVAAKMQIFPDGVHWEQSPMYHNEVMQCFFDVIILARRNGIALPEAVEAGVRKMALADLAWIKPDGHQFMTGDSDCNDIRDILGTAACLFNDANMRWAASSVLAYDSVWDMGADAARSYEAMKPERPDFTSVQLEHSGHTVLRSGWGERANVLHMTCGTMGAGHGHADKLHIDLVLNGKDVLVDGGRLTYVYGEARKDIKEPAGHNTITVDGRPFTETSQTWEYSKMCQPVKQHFRALERCELAQAGHLGYMDIPDGVYVNRKVIYIKPDIYVIVDEMYTSGAHDYQQYWHFSEGGSVELGENSALFRWERTEARVFFLSHPALTMVASVTARHYGYPVENACIRAEIHGEGFCSMFTVISSCEDITARMVPVSSALKGTIYPSNMAEAVSISAHGREYVVAVCHQEVSSPTDLIEAEGCMGYGCVIVFDKENNALVGDVLCY